MRVPAVSAFVLLAACADGTAPAQLVIEHIGPSPLALDSAQLAGGEAGLWAAPSDRLHLALQVGEQLVVTPSDGLALSAGDLTAELLVTEVSGDGFAQEQTDPASLVSVSATLEDGWLVLTVTGADGGVAASSSTEGLLWSADASPSAELTALQAGDAAPLSTWLDDNSGLLVPLASPTWAVGAEPALFTIGGAASSGLEQLAEDGSGEALASELEARGDLTDWGFMPAPEGDYGSRPAMPGERFVLDLVGATGDRVAAAWMFADSNDVFFAVDAPLFDDEGNLLTGEVDTVALYDAGTELNQPPGVGSDQAPRQSGPDTGEDEGGSVSALDDPLYPAASSIVRVSIQGG